jgi:tricarballylate dehydrogenase
LTETFDVAVLGGGNAGLCAALSARERGARVIVLEGAPRAFRGGNSRHTRNLRSMHHAPTALLTDAYSEDEYVADLVRVTAGRTDESLARLSCAHRPDAPTGCRSSGSGCSHHCGARCISDERTCFFLAAAKR